MFWQMFLDVLLGIYVLKMKEFVGGTSFEVTGPTGTTGGADFVPLESPYQTELTVDFDFIFFSGSSFDDTGTTIRPDRYTCSKTEVEFEVDPDDQLTIIANVKTKFSPPKNAECDIDWKDGTVDSIKFNDGPEVAAEHTYTNRGLFRPVFFCSGKNEGSEACPSYTESCLTDVNIFDPLFKSIDTPLKLLVTEPFGVFGHLNIAPACLSYTPEYNWRMLHVQNGSTTAYNFTQPNLAILKLQPETVDPGMYIVELEITFPDKSESDYIADFLYVRVILPELIASISGGNEITFPAGEIYYVNASKSRDPVTRLESITSLPLNATWSVVCYGSLYFISKNRYMVDFPTGTLPTTAVDFGIQDGTDYSLVFDTSLASSYSYCFILFTLERGERQSSTLQVVKLVDNAFPVSLSCVFNCNRGREMKMTQEQIQFDSVVDVTGPVTYRWQIFLWEPVLGIYLDFSWLIATQTGYTTRSLGVDEGTLSSGKTYRFTLTVTAPNMASSNAHYVRTVNYLPYAGTCVLDILSGTASIDLFTLNCQGWQGADERKTLDNFFLTNLIDINPLLSFNVIQVVPNAAIEEEPIACSRSRKFSLLLKLGDPDNSYWTTLLVRVTDLYKNYREISLNVQSFPAFDYTLVDKTQAGAGIVQNFMDTDFLTYRNNLFNLGIPDLVVIHATSVASHFYQIGLPEWHPPVPRNVDSPSGAILDLQPGGNNTKGTLEGILEEAANETIDPATVEIQKAVELLTASLVEILSEQVVNGTRREDKKFISTITNALTNMIAKSNYVTENVELSLIKAGTILSDLALFPPEGVVEGDDDGPQIEESSSELVEMYTNTVNSVVPDTLSQINLELDGLTSGRYQIRDQLAFSKANFSVEDAEMSPPERAFLYIRLQAMLSYNIDAVRGNAQKAARSTLKMARDIQKAAKLCKTCSNEGRNKTKQILVKHDADVVSKRNIPAKNASVQLTGLKDNGNESVSASIVNFDENVFMYDSNKKSSHISSGIIHIDVKSTETDAAISLGYITYSQDVPTPDTLQVEPVLDEEDASYFSIHKFQYKTTGDYVCIVIEPAEPGVREYKMYFRFYDVPTFMEYSFIKYARIEDSWKVCVAPSDMKGNVGISYLGVAMDKEKEVKKQSYFFTLITVACMVWDEEAKEWFSDKCDLEWLPDRNAVNCQCRNVKDLTLANSFYVAPNTIDFASVFLKFSPLNQAAVMGTLSGLFVIYILAVLWARRMDRGDVLRWGITPLRDNYYDDSIFYIFHVYTGLRRGAGTKSRVGFILTGQEGDTGERELSDAIRKGFSRGSMMSFLVATPSHLGELLHICLWHDNSGKDGDDSWYISKIIVQDIHKDDVYTFVCERWLSLDTTLEIQAIPNERGKAIPFSSRFFHQAKERLSDGHMWISIVYRPVTSNFTRSQRVSCVLVYLMLTMIASAIYFNPADDVEVPALVQVGPLRFTLQQMYISLISALISTPTVLLVAFLFKRSKRQPAPDNNYYVVKRNTNDVKPSKASWLKRQRQHSLELEQTLLTKGIPEYDGCYLHYNFEFVGWAVVFMGTIIPAFFIMLYSMQWGKQKSEEWLSSFFLSMIESFIFIDPIMVLAIAFLLAIVLRASGPESLRLDKVQLLLTFRKRFRRLCFRRNPPPRPTDKEGLEEAARRHRNQEFLKSSVKNIVINMFFMWVIFSICYINRDNRSYGLHREIANKLLQPSGFPQFQDIKTPGDLFVWLNDTVFPNLFPEQDINGVDLHWTQKEFMTGFVSYRLGPPRLRQLRTTEGTCTIPHFGTVDCYGEYEFLKEDTEDYCIGWNATKPCSPTEALFNFSSEAWKFTSALDVWGLPMSGFYTTYGGGGYIAEFAVNRPTSIQILNELYDNSWLDRQTRAVILEFTLFCGNVNLFVYNMFMVEFPQTGGAFVSYNIFPLRLYLHEGPLGSYTIVLEVIFIVYLIFLLVKICITFYQQRCGFFRHVWSVYELIQFCLGVSAVGIYFIRLGFTYLTIDRFLEDKKLFVNFHHIVFWDYLLVALLGFLVFMATLRILQIFSTSKKVSALVKVFQDCGRDLFWFGMNFLWMFVGFAILFYLLFGYLLFSYMSVYRSVTTLFTSVIGYKMFREVDESHPLLARIFFFLFVITVIFFVLTMFMSILSGSIDNAVQGARQDKQKDLVDFMMDWFKNVVSRQRREATANTTEITVAPAPNTRNRGERTKPPRKPIVISS